MSTIKENRARSEESFRTHLRVHAILDLASLYATDAFDDPFGPAQELVHDLLDASYEVHPSAASLRKVIVDSESAPNLPLGEFLSEHSLLGMAVNFVTPAGGLGWGYTQGTWIYAENFESAWKLGVAWAKKIREDAAAEGQRTTQTETLHG